jgi:hypothetical protein
MELIWRDDLRSTWDVWLIWLGINLRTLKMLILFGVPVPCGSQTVGLLMMAGPDPICVWVEWWLWNNIDSGQICYSRSSWHWWQWNWARFQASSRLSPVFVLLSILWIDAITLKSIISRFHNVLTQNCWWNNTGLQEAKQKLGRCHLVKETSNTTQPLELLLWCFQFVLWLLTGGKYSTTIGNSFCTLSIGFFLVILVYDHSYWAYSCCRPKNKIKLL